MKKKLIKRYNITIDSKSGYSGAGKNYLNKFRHKNFYQSAYAYAVTNHRHTSEIEQIASLISGSDIELLFTPHLIPTFRGMLSTIYIKSKKSIEDIYSTLDKFYKNEPFIKIFNSKMINTDKVINTNMVHISINKSNAKNTFIISSSIDNLLKGAAGQAIQNFNIRFNFDEKLGLI